MAAAVRPVIGSCQIREEGAVESQGAHGTDEAGCYARLRYAAAISAISELQRVRKSRRWSASKTGPSPLRRTPKYCRSSSNAARSRDADAKLPEPSIG